MDVVWGETAGVDGQLWLLCPILFILQVMYAKLGHYLLNIYRSMLLQLFSYRIILYIKLTSPFFLIGYLLESLVSMNYR